MTLSEKDKIPGVSNSLRMEEQSHTLSVRMAWITSGFSPSTALRAARLRTSIPSKSCRFTGHRMARILAYCAATPILMWYSCKNPNRKTRDQHFLALWKDADPDIPVLKQAKAEYAKLQ